MQTAEDYSGYWIRGYFKPPRDGSYVFKLAADDYSRLYFNSVPREIRTVNLKEIAKTCNY